MSDEIERAARKWYEDNHFDGIGLDDDALVESLATMMRGTVVCSRCGDRVRRQLPRAVCRWCGCERTLCRDGSLRQFWCPSASARGKACVPRPAGFSSVVESGNKCEHGARKGECGDVDCGHHVDEETAR